MNMLQLNPPLPVTTPRGDALAHVLIDYGAEHDLLWVTFQDNGQCWTWRNSEIRAVKNVTMGRANVGVSDRCRHPEWLDASPDTGGTA
jgi:hypothetical protein